MGGSQTGGAHPIIPTRTRTNATPPKEPPHYDYSTKSVTIIDPKPSEALIELSNTLGATLIEKSISEITKEDLE